MDDLRAIEVICRRELIRFFRVRSRWLDALVRPLLWLVVVGNGLDAIVRPQGPHSYLQTIFPGIVAMTILFAAIFSSATIVWDREFGFLREMLVAPIPRRAIVLGKVAAGTLISAAEAAIVLLVTPLLGLRPTAAQLGGLAAAVAIVSFSVTALGVLLSATVRTFDGYNLVMNFLVMPLFLLSGAMYPVTSMPPVLRHLSLANPVTYCVDVFKHVLLGGAGPEFSLTRDLAVVAFLGMAALLLAARAFRRRE